MLKRTKLGALGFGPSYCRSDECSLCHSWDITVHGCLTSAYSEAVKALLAECPRFFDGMNLDDIGRQCDSLAFCEEFMAKLSEHRDSHPECAASALADTILASRVDDARDGVANVTYHWGLHDTVRDAHRRDLEHMPPKEAGMLYDLKAPSSHNPAFHVT